MSRRALSVVALLVVAVSLVNAQQPEIRTGIFRGRKVTYTWVPNGTADGGGKAIFQGDIILDHVQEIPSRVQIDSIGLAYSQYLWPKVGSVYQVPYTIDPSSQDRTNLNAALTQFNNTFAGVIQFVPRTTETDYVNFLFTAQLGGVCEAYEGRTGGEQTVGGDGDCAVATILHEMGHAVGVWHEQSRPDRDTYVNVNYGAVIKAARSNFDKLLDDDQLLTLYDYASVMEYPAFSFVRNGIPAIETIPAGIPLSNPNGYSASDIDGIKRLYGAVPSSVTVTSNPPGLKVIVDGATVTTPQTFNWSLNSTHTLNVSSTPQTLNGINYIYGRWNDSTTQSHTITVTPGNNMVTQPASAPAVTVYSANFIQLVQYANTISPAGTGTVTPTPAPQTYSGLSGQYYIIRQQVTLTATPNPGQNFYNYINSPFYLPGGIGANPKTFYVMDDGNSINLTTYFTSSPVYTVTASPQESNVGVYADLCGSNPCFWYAPVNFALPYDSTWTPSSTHSIGIASPQSPWSYYSRFEFSNWSDGGAQNHTITLPSSGGATYTANIAPQYYVADWVQESCAGSINVSPGSPTGDGFYPSGDLLTFTETPNTGWTFTGWLYDLSGTGNPQNLTVGDEVLVAADYSTTSTPLQLTSISPASVTAGSAGFTLTINGQGFTSSTAAYIGGFYRQPTFISSTKITVPIQASDISTAGAFQVAVGNFPSGASCAAYVPTTFFVLLSSGATATVSPASLSFGSVAAGTASSSQPITLTNGGSGPLSISGITASGDFSQSNNCGSSLAAGSSCTVNVTFNPVLSGAVSGAITFADSAGTSPQLVSLSGTGVLPLSFKPAKLSFGSVAVGHTSSKTVTVTNNQTTTIGLSPSTSADYSVTGGTCGSSLAGGAKCTITVTFAPASSGVTQGALALATNGAFSPQVFGLAGTGTGGPAVPLTFSPTSLALAKTAVGSTSAAKVVTVTNSSGSSVTITGLSGSSGFSAVGSGATPCGGALATGAKCTFSATFSPSMVGAIKGSVAVATNAAGSPQVITANGTAVAAVTLSPTSINFGNQPVGTTSAPKTVTLKNSSSSAVTLTSIAASGDFLASPSGSKPCGGSIAAGGKCTFSVTFTPNATGAIAGAVTVIHNAPLGPSVMSLSGTGQ